MSANLTAFSTIFLCSKARRDEQVFAALTATPVQPHCGGEMQRESLSATPADCTWSFTGWVWDSDRCF